MAKAERLIRRTQGERSSATRSALVRATMDCICEVGYSATTTGMIADRADVSRGAVQHHFGSRDDLILAVIDLVQYELNLSISLDVLRSESLEQRIALVIAQYRKVFTSKAFAAALNIWLGAKSEPTLYTRLQKHLIDMQVPIEELWGQAFNDVNLPPERLKAIRRIAMSAVRGYTIQEMFGLTGRWEDDSRELRGMVLCYLNSGGNPN